MSGCAPLVPDNFLSPTTVQTSQKINNQWVRPRIIPVSVKMLNSPEGRELLVPAMKPQPYRVGAFDNLNIIVWGHPEISTITTGSLPSINAFSLEGNTISSAASNPPILVQSDGTIFYPYVGHLKVEDLTINEIQDVITKRLSAYIRNPQVTVQVAKYRRNVYVLGEVKAPGMQSLTDKPFSVMEAISNAGGISTGSADPSHIYLIRGSYQQPDVFWINLQSPQALLIAEKFPLQENDIVYVSAAIFNSWNSFVGTIFPTFTTYWTIKGLSHS